MAAEVLMFWGHNADARAPVGKHCLSQWWGARSGRR
jgi:hypothetical protein